MTELLRLPPYGVLIEPDMSVIPRCGFCLEPLLSAVWWQSTQREADRMVLEGNGRDETLRGVLAFLSDRYADHVDRTCRIYVIDEEVEVS